MGIFGYLFAMNLLSIQPPPGTTDTNNTLSSTTKIYSTKGMLSTPQSPSKSNSMGDDKEEVIKMTGYPP